MASEHVIERPVQLTAQTETFLSNHTIPANNGKKRPLAICVCQLVRRVEAAGKWADEAMPAYSERPIWSQVKCAVRACGGRQDSTEYGGGTVLRIVHTYGGKYVCIYMYLRTVLYMPSLADANWHGAQVSWG